MYMCKCLFRNKTNFNLVVSNFNLKNTSQLFHSQTGDQHQNANDDSNEATKHINLKESASNDFEKEFYENRIEVTPFQNALLAVGSSLMALTDPHRNDMIAALGETTGYEALNNILIQMRQSYEGCDILANKPRINTSTVNLSELRKLPSDTFGHTYVKFLDDNKVTPDSRLGVRFLDDVNLGYVMQRYRECHDLYHAVLGMPTHMLGEVTVKWFEALNTKLPMCIGGAIFGSLRLRPKQRALYRKHYLPWALQTGQNAPLLLSIYWERRWEQKIDDLREELRIKTLEIPK